MAVMVIHGMASPGEPRRCRVGNGSRGLIWQGLARQVPVGCAMSSNGGYMHKAV